ncbi:DUF7572 family protein [Mycobacterium aquaticum]|uniref:DUF7572 domain-containing protein n=1 Tax=Mycobacterium aquaticum TaxID=1927124 RepID=A0A1X0A096_9MYCO|nr:hypothetical protein [Mycobacterium aquaticum]ORA23394.1 hypothetical protein BST13_35155 [Mycobacterium aquaticum]
MSTASLVAEALPQFAPTTNHYACSDGWYLLVTVHDRLAVATTPSMPFDIPIARSHLPASAEVFLCDEHATVLDADGDPANGMTPLALVDADTHAAALVSLGYTVA